MNPEILEQVSDIVGMVADEMYESWDDYWSDHTKVVQSIIDILDNWNRYSQLEIKVKWYSED